MLGLGLVDGPGLEGILEFKGVSESDEEVELVDRLKRTGGLDTLVAGV